MRWIIGFVHKNIICCRSFQNSSKAFDNWYRTPLSISYAQIFTVYSNWDSNWDYCRLWLILEYLCIDWQKLKAWVFAIKRDTGTHVRDIVCKYFDFYSWSQKVACKKENRSSSCSACPLHLRTETGPSIPPSSACDCHSHFCSHAHFHFLHLEASSQLCREHTPCNLPHRHFQFCKCWAHTKGCTHPHRITNLNIGKVCKDNLTTTFMI